MTDVTVRDYYDRLAPGYDESRFGHAYGRHIDTLERSVLKRWLAGSPPEEVVDIGCGTGRLLDFARTGVDASPEMLAVAAAKHPEARLVVSSLPNLDLPEAGFAAATCFHVFMHLEPDLVAASLAEIARVVRPGGRLVFDIPGRLRRSLGRPRTREVSWHAETSGSAKEIMQRAGPSWRIRRRTGLLVLPMHRAPGAVFAPAAVLDGWLGASPLQPLASYHVYELERRS